MKKKKIQYSRKRFSISFTAVIAPAVKQYPKRKIAIIEFNKYKLYKYNKTIVTTLNLIFKK